MKVWRDVNIGEIIESTDRIHTYKGWVYFYDMNNTSVGESVTEFNGNIQRLVTPEESLRYAEHSWHKHAASLPVGEDREKAIRVLAWIKNAWTA